MNCLTLNSHSLMGEYDAIQVATLANFIATQDIDVIALQEVNQTMSATLLTTPAGYTSVSATPLRADNFAAQVIATLANQQLTYYFSWLPCHIGYDRYDEGVAILTKTAPIATKSFRFSETSAYDDYHTRQALGVQLANNDWFFSIHSGWWQADGSEFSYQWQQLTKALSTLAGRQFLMGDFNNPAHIRQQGYDHILADGWHDTYTLAAQKDQGVTVSGAIDGWRETQADDKRIDFIFCNERVDVLKSQTVFNGHNEAVISDHYGVCITLNE